MTTDQSQKELVCPTDSCSRQDHPSPSQDQSWPAFLQSLYRAHFLADLSWRQDDLARSPIHEELSCRSLAISPSKMELLSVPQSLSSLLSSPVMVAAHPQLCRRTSLARFPLSSIQSESEGPFAASPQATLPMYRVCGNSACLVTWLIGISTVFDPD